MHELPYQTKMWQNGAKCMSDSEANRRRHTVARGNSVTDATDGAREILEIFLRRVQSESAGNCGQPRSVGRPIAEVRRLLVPITEISGSRESIASVVMTAGYDEVDGLPPQFTKLPDVSVLSVGDDRRLPKQAMLAEPEDSDLSDVDDDVPSGDEDVAEKKKKKSLFKRARERMRATFTLNPDTGKPSPRKEKHIDRTESTEKKNWFVRSLQRRSRDSNARDSTISYGEAASCRSNSIESKSKHGIVHSSRNLDSDVSSHGGKSHKSRSVLSSVRQKVRNSFRRKRSPSDTSGDETSIREPSESQKKLLVKYMHGQDGVDHGHQVALSNNSNENACILQHDHSRRPDLHLDIPDSPFPISLNDSGVQSAMEDRCDGFDYIDGPVESKVKPSVVPPLQHATSRPFTDKSPGEKEELYEHIAAQLAGIGDMYSPQAQPSKSLNMEGLLTELAQSTNYSSFQRVLGEAIRNESSLQQLAMWFRVSTDAMKIAGQSTTVVNRLKNMTLQYFENHFASWVVNSGGWESIVSDGPATTDSELD